MYAKITQVYLDIPYINIYIFKYAIRTVYLLLENWKRYKLQKVSYTFIHSHLQYNFY